MNIFSYILSLFKRKPKSKRYLIDDAWLADELKRAQECYQDDINTKYILDRRGVMSVSVVHYVAILKELVYLRKKSK